MDWTYLASVSETVAAFAVVGTLAYIGLEHRRSRLLSVAGGTLLSLEVFSKWRLALLQNSDLAVVVAKTRAGEALNEVEAVQFGVLCEDLFVAVCVSYANSAQSGSIHDRSAEVQYISDMIRENKGAMAEWDRVRFIVDAISQDFRSVVDQRIKLLGNS